MESPIPFHIPSIIKPQIQYNFHIDNSNKPYTHPDWLPKSQDGSSKPIHPVESYNPLDFVNFPTPLAAQPVKPPPLESTPFTFIDNVDKLNYLASKLQLVSEFAVDLEHNSYRSFQGLTCLMQISTRDEDFVIDTLKIWDHIGEVLGVFFLDPDKRKIMHGADNDVFWLQRDFQIYVCNLFDTMQASRVLKTERNTLGFLLKHFCGVDVNKLYNASDWRLRPLPCEMVHYAREDTHYLLYLYDLIRLELESEPAKLISGFQDPLAEAYKRSFGVCSQLYEKELYDEETSYLLLYGLEDANLDAQQLAIVAGLCGWRDRVAREEDESTGYVLPNKQILKMANCNQLPFNQEEVMQILGYNRDFVVRDADLILKIIWSSARIHAPKFEGIATQLRNGVLVSEIIARKQQELKRSSNYSHHSCNTVQKEHVQIVASRVPVLRPVFWASRGPVALPRVAYWQCFGPQPVDIIVPVLVGYSPI